MQKFIQILACIAAISLSTAMPVEEDKGQQVFRAPNLRLLATSEHELQWADPDVFMDKNIQFIDVTDHLDLELGADRIKAMNEKYPLPTHLSHATQVKSLISSIDTGRMKARLEKFTSFKNRYYKGKYGVMSNEWLYTTLQDIVKETGADVTIEYFEHSWLQKSILVRFAGKSAGNADEVPMVIVGAHQDTVRGGFMTDGRAPGADDDGSGSMTTLEAFTLLCESGFAPERPVEFHWYSAEEAGLLGSQDVAAAYQRQGRPVMGMIQFDMTGYGKNGVYGIITDYVDPQLTDFLRSLANAYGGIKPVNTKCNYGCSDHASWNRAGYRSAFSIEGEFKDSSPYIHTSQDTVENIDVNHMKEFVKLALSFAVELSGDEEM